MKKRSLKSLVVMIFAVSFAAACVAKKNAGTNADGASVTLPAVAPTVMVPNGAELYEANCSTCHGLKGEGDKRGIPLIRGHALNHTEAQYNAQIRFGKGNKMPAFKDMLSADETAAIVNYVRNVIQAGIERGPEHH